MIIKKKSIRSLSFLNGIPSGINITIQLDDISRFSNKLVDFGCDVTADKEEWFIPLPVNAYAEKNKFNFITKDKNSPKEQREMISKTQIYSNNTWRTKEKSYTRMVYKKIQNKAYGVQFKVIDEELISEEIAYSAENTSKIINTINMLLNFFGECSVKCDEPEFLQDAKKVNWQVLPQGRFPWLEVKDSLTKILNKNIEKTRVDFKYCEEINKLQPDFIAYGKASFYGYVIFGFTNLNIYVLESVYSNNATYVFENDWETLSQKTKSEILSNNLHKMRIIHNKKWQEKLNACIAE